MSRGELAPAPRAEGRGGEEWSLQIRELLL